MTASPPAAPGMPSEETILRVVQGVMDRDNHSVALKASREILSLIRQAFEAKDAEIERANELLKGDELLERCVKSAVLIDQLNGEIDEMKRRALSAEAKLAQAVEVLERAKQERLKLDRRIHNQRVALRENWEIVEMRRKALRSSALSIYKRGKSLMDQASAAARGEKP